MKTKKTLIVTINIILWIATMIPILILLYNCFYSAIYGAYHGFNGDVMIYGIAAFMDTFFACLIFGVLYDIIWFVLFIIALGFTIFMIIYLRRYK